ncbi:MAG: hypothetical protein Q8S54_13265 [Bacteroidota bacterium]|nr:hypothetical protein [Bacteroidota bacterium]
MVVLIKITIKSPLIPQTWDFQELQDKKHLYFNDQFSEPPIPKLPSLFWASLFKYLFEISRIQITLIVFSLNLILNGYLSRKFALTAQNLITLFGLYRLLIELDKCLIFFRVTNISMMFWLVNDVNKVIRFDPSGYILTTEVIFFKNKVF